MSVSMCVCVCVGVCLRVCASRPARDIPSLQRHAQDAGELGAAAAGEDEQV